MEIKEQIKLRFTGVDFPIVNLSSIKAHKDKILFPLDVNIEPKVFLPKGKNSKFNIIINVFIKSENHFSLEIMAIGYFELSEENVTEEIRKEFINANSTAIMFPYVRSFISLLTSNIGDVMSSITLPTRFFKGDLQEMTSDESEKTSLLLSNNSTNVA